ncbi:ethanolamine ammonia-lyase subunit EutC [Novosphingobium sediminis]|uniref:ethanolamine ammonia-lyase subunit EutC n=1 Tax=Novosphingobium sediminis TaxID=707214 RepID=UPI001FEA2BDF|nr:ethanolamine ammonia-lyase subunit EutC [Novosphingobium sediminis]
MAPGEPINAELWARLRRTTPARIALGRVGHALPLGEVLDFQLAHARARDAVHAALDTAALEAELAPLPVLHVASDAPDRATYLRRPDLGRRLSEQSAALLAAAKGKRCDVAFVIADGLSATGVQAGAATLLKACAARLGDLAIGPVVIARQARVALGDPIGEALGARVAVMIIGERPGLSVHDSLGIYMTFAPRPGRSDAERNCISNIHGAGGLSPNDAARTLGWLLREALRLELSGVALKDDQTPALPFEDHGPA